VIAAYALQVTTAFIYVRGEFALGLERVTEAVNDAYGHGAVGGDIFGSGFSVDIVVHPGAGAYICGRRRHCSRVSRASAASPGSSPRTSPPPSDSTGSRRW